MRLSIDTVAAGTLAAFLSGSNRELKSGIKPNTRSGSNGILLINEKPLLYGGNVLNYKLFLSRIKIYI